MKQYDWTYVSNLGKRFHVGLLHSPSSGHLLIFVNTSISVIDFSVLETKAYSLFLDDQLCEIRIDRMDDRFKYSFHINKEADTPLNQARKKMERKHFKQSFAVVAVLIILIACFVWAFKSMQQNRFSGEDATLLAKESQQTEGRLLLNQRRNDSIYYFSYVVQGKAYRKKLSDQYFKGQRLTNGFLPKANDAFQISYYPPNPHISQIHLDQPTSRQIEKYQKRAYTTQLKQHPEKDRAYHQCLVQQAYELFDVKGLARIVNQHKAESSHPQFNRNAYLRMIRSKAMRKALETQCLGLD